MTYRPEDLSETVEMTREYYGESWVSDPEFLRWQYQANPAGPAVALLARDTENGRLAGQYVVVPVRLQADGDSVRALLSLNTLTREAYWGQGVFTGLARAVLRDCQDQGFAVCYGFPNQKSYHGLVHTLGFTDLGRVPLLLRPLDLRSLVRARFGAFAAALASPLGVFYRIRERSEDAWEVRLLGVSDLGDVETFWGRVRGKYPIMGVRDKKYFRWRYFDVPLREYLVYGLYDKGGSDLLGYVVGRYTEVEGLRAGMVVDLLVAEGLPRPAGGLLVRVLLGDLAARGADVAGSLMLSHTEESRILRANGFLRCPRALEPQPFPFCSLRMTADEKGGPDPLAHLERWFLTMGDYDVI